MMQRRKPISKENATVRLESLCARAEHCTYELMTKLRGWGITGEVAEDIINGLIDNRGRSCATVTGFRATGAAR